MMRMMLIGEEYLVESSLLAVGHTHVLCSQLLSNLLIMNQTELVFKHNQRDHDHLCFICSFSYCGS